jgi:hypothetical protein
MAKLGQLLVARGWITVQQLTRALKNQNVAGGRLGTCLLEMDAITEELLLKGLAEQLGVPTASGDDLRGVPEEVVGLLHEKLARRCRAVPFRVEGGRLDLALMDPRNLSAQDEIAFASGKRVKVFVAEEVRILEALERYYGEECPSRFALVLDRLNRARFLWEKKPVEQPEPEPLFDSPFAPPPKMNLAPALPELMPIAPQPAPPVPAAILWSPDELPPPRSPGLSGVQPSTAAAPAAAAPVVPAVPAAPPAQAAAPVPIQRAKSVSLTPEERAELGSFAAEAPAEPAAPAVPPAPAKPPAVERPPTQPIPLPAALPTRPQELPPTLPMPVVPPLPASLEEAIAALQEVSDLEEVSRVLLGYVGRSHRRVALFQVSRDRVNAWKVQGTGIDRDAFAAFSIGFDQPSIFLNLRHGGGVYFGPLPPMPAHRQLARTWGGDLPRDCVMLPVRIKDRLILILYADGAVKGPVELPQMQRLLDAATAAVERCILTNRQRGEAKS